MQRSPTSFLVYLKLSELMFENRHRFTIGHSERRTLFDETSELVALKTKAAIEASLNVILCIGETLDQRESGLTAQVNEKQLKAVIDVLKESDWRYVPLSY